MEFKNKLVFLLHNFDLYIISIFGEPVTQPHNEVKIMLHLMNVDNLNMK